MEHININDLHKQSFTWKEKIAIWVTDRIGTIECAILFAGIGIGSIVGLITGNVWLGVGLGGFSSYFLQLVMLPLISIKQNIDQSHAELVAENTYSAAIATEKILMGIHEKLDNIIDGKGENARSN